MTAVQWLIEQLKKGEVAYGMFNLTFHDDIFQQAKQMEREQIEDAYVHGYTDGFNTAKHDDYFDFTDGSDYFTQTYQQ